MAAKPLPDAIRLRKLLRYDRETGKLYWRPRAESDYEDHPTNASFSAFHQARRWNARYAGKEAFTKKHKWGYLYGSVDRRTILSHRAAWAIHFGEWPTQAIDHANGDQTDNRIANLRLATASENMRNQRKPSTNKSGYKGVSWDEHRSKWRAQISVERKKFHLGYFDTPEAAYRAYSTKSAKLHGEFSRIA